MNEPTPPAKTDEEALVKLYAELTGAGETAGRATFIYLDEAEAAAAESEGPTSSGKSAA
jgi:hypothetical protein